MFKIFKSFIYWSFLVVLLLILIVRGLDVTRLPTDYETCFGKTESRFDKIHIAVLSYYIKNNVLPDSLEEIVEYDQSIAFHDGWNVPIIYQKIDIRRCTLTADSQKRRFSKFPKYDLIRDITVPLPLDKTSQPQTNLNK